MWHRRSFAAPCFTPLLVLLTLLLLPVARAGAAQTCSQWVNCGGGKQMRACASCPSGGGTCQGWYESSDGKTFACASSSNCQAAAQATVNWCLNSTGASCPTKCGGVCCSASQQCCGSACAPSSATCCGAGYCTSGQQCCNEKCISGTETCCGGGACSAGEVCASGQCCSADTPLYNEGMCCPTSNPGCGQCTSGNKCGMGCCASDHPYCCWDGSCAIAVGNSWCASKAGDPPPPPPPPCMIGEERCGDGCCSTFSYCCNGKCIESASKCCGGEPCKTSCCGDTCLPPEGVCCPDGSTCPAQTPACCNGGTCAVDVPSCPTGAANCPSTHVKCASGACCPASSPTCCGSGTCAPLLAKCCGNGYYCTPSAPKCCGSFCCPEDAQCGDSRCVRAGNASGAAGIVPSTPPDSTGAKAPRAPSPGQPPVTSGGSSGGGGKVGADELGYSCGGCNGDAAKTDARPEKGGSSSPLGRAPGGGGARLAGVLGGGPPFLVIVGLGLSRLWERRRRR